MLRQLSGEERRLLILEGSLYKAVFFLAWPMVIQSLMMILVGAVDMMMVGALGSDAVGAVGMARQVIQIIGISIMAVGVGSTATIARYYGYNDIKGAVNATGQALYLLFLFSLIITTVGLVFSEGIMHLLGAEGDLLTLGTGYLQIFFAGSLFFLGNFTLRSIFQGTGDTKTPTQIDVATNLLNIALNYLLIFGVGPVPALGVPGAALGSLLSRVFAFSVGLYALKHRGFYYIPSVKEFMELSTHKMKQILRIGIPAALQGITRSGGNIVVLGMIARTAAGNDAVSGYSVGLMVFAFALFPAQAVGKSAATIIGMNLGAYQKDRAEESGWKCTGMGMGIIALFSLIVFIFAPQFIRLFVDDPEVVRIGASFVRILAVVEPIHAMGLILANALHGAGETVVPFYISLLSWVILRVPFAYFFAFGLGFQETGIWIGIAVTQVIQGVLTALKFREGKWKDKEITESSSENFSSKVTGKA
ncbi:MATE family efflux transporter [Natranaerobius thermophilus]|uniref:Probable multidrug resistance protein NorM n=1 Tax=Natranaerobius thermophilus (strain ATCC BAA-1301 / DSM 18059 / JW/NM-WN-LF) TaxID=457570 RepID=B2A8H7_NATTJ|nr:MATE family efflux transporter [Natranaerobius thermophilus]ACB85861.1 MATE efflux family protein [Natranaerobius thermophilus JW/NM-WN-LF]